MSNATTDRPYTWDDYDLLDYNSHPEPTPVMTAPIRWGDVTPGESRATPSKLDWAKDISKPVAALCWDPEDLGGE